MEKNQREQLEKALRSNDIVAEVVKLAAVVDFHLDLYLGIQFGGPVRIDDFMEHIAPRLPLAVKIEILKKMKFHKPMKSHSNIIESAERIRRIRNKVAHSHSLKQKDIDAILSDKKLVKFILEYPASFERERKMLDNSFSHLWRSWEIRWKKWLTVAAANSKRAT